MARGASEQTNEADEDERASEAGDGDDGGSGAASGGIGGPSEAPPEASASVRSISFEEFGADLPPVHSPGPLRPNRGGARPGAGRKAKTGGAAPESKPTKAKTASTASPKLTPDTQAAGALLQLVEGSLMLTVGRHAEMSAYERTMIEPPLGRMLGRMAPESVAKFSAFADPIALLLGIVAYSTRVFVTRDRNAQPGGSRPAARPVRTAPAEPAPPLGTVRTVPNGGVPAGPAQHANGAVLDADDVEIAEELGAI